jgi:hypothetical protein
MNRYLTEKVTAIALLDGYRLRITFADGFTGEVDLAPLLDAGPIFAPWRDVEFFRSVKPVCGVPEWSDTIDLSPGALRAWCEAGRFLDYDETDAWIARHSHSQEVA